MFSKLWTPSPESPLSSPPQEWKRNTRISSYCSFLRENMSELFIETYEWLDNFLWVKISHHAAAQRKTFRDTWLLIIDKSFSNPPQEWSHPRRRCLCHNLRVKEPEEKTPLINYHKKPKLENSIESIIKKEKYDNLYSGKEIKKPYR